VKHRHREFRDFYNEELQTMNAYSNMSLFWSSDLQIGKK
jgi:hypothetical protein